MSEHSYDDMIWLLSVAASGLKDVWEIKDEWRFIWIGLDGILGNTAGIGQSASLTEISMGHSGSTLLL